MTQDQITEGKLLAQRVILFAMRHSNLTVRELRNAVRQIFGDEVEAALKADLQPNAGGERRAD